MEQMLRKKFDDILKWNSAERIIRLNQLDDENKGQKRKRDSKLLFNELLKMDVLDIISLQQALSNIVLKTDRENFLRRQLKLLKETGLKFSKNRIWCNRSLNTEQKLLLKIKDLHEVE